MPKMTTSEIAMCLAMNAKAGGFDDFGPLYDDAWNLTDAEWKRVCEEAEALLPTVTPPKSLYASWAQAARDVRAEAAAERRAFGGDW